uniref:Uncharacterized protein n=1 Tax=Tanacetum cinerariifolium TaxID=118510 RepID=A0A6L2K9C5_TANCI|nr:hypothetical protein [Tanacetum cinerariifolium]
MSVLRSHAGWKAKHFKGISLEEIREKFDLVWKQMQDFVLMSSKEEGERVKRKGLSLEQESAKKVKTSEEVSEEDLKQMMHLVPVKEVYVEALQVKHPIIDWEIQTEGQRSYWKIIRLGGSTASYQFFVDMLKHFDREDLNQLWALVKETLNIRQAAIEWRLYDSCGVYHILSRDQEIFMLVEREHPLRKGLAIVMISNKLQVENYSQMATELIQKIHKIANSPRQRSILTISDEFPLPEEVPTASEEKFPMLKKRNATAEKIALLMMTRILISGTTDKSMVEEVTPLKEDFKQKENKYLEEFLDMKALKEKNKVGIGYKNLLYLTRVQQVQPALYNGHELIKTNHVSAIVHNFEETLEIAEITRKKMNDKIKDPEGVTDWHLEPRFIENQRSCLHQILQSRTCPFHLRMHRFRVSASSAWSSQIHWRPPHSLIFRHHQHHRTRTSMNLSIPVDLPTAESPGYVVELNPKEDPEEYEDDESEDGPVDYPLDGGDDGEYDDDDSSGDDADDEDEDEEDEEEEEHLASADSTVVIPTVKHVSPPEGTKHVIPPPSTNITTTEAKITVWLQAFISLLPEVEVGRLLAMPTPPPSPITLLSPPFAGEHLARCTTPSAHSSPPPVPSPLLPSSGCPTQILTLRIASTQALIDAVIATLPSPPLLPPLYLPPLVDHAEARRRGNKEVGYGIRDTWVDSAEADPEIESMTLGEANTRVTKLAELHEHDTQDLYAQESRTRISQRVTMDSQRVDLLMEDRIAHQETILIVEEEAYASREA